MFLFRTLFGKPILPCVSSRKIWSAADTETYQYMKSLWHFDCPDDYISLGDLVSRSKTKLLTDVEHQCVHRSLTTKSNNSKLIW